MDQYRYAIDKLQKFIITTPHAACIDGVAIRTCDTNAENATKALIEAIKNKGISDQDITVFQHDTYPPRFIVDANREEGRILSMRKRLTKFLQSIPDNEKDNIVHIDVHSFPNTNESFGFNPPPLVILDNREGSIPLWKNITNDLGPQTVRLLEGSQKNDIVATVRNSGIKKSILLEFREDLNEPQLKTVATLFINKI